MGDLMKTRAFKSLRDVMEYWGFSNTEASIYALLSLSQEPMGAREIAKEIKRAYSSVVNELNKLIRYGLVERTKGERCYQYAAIIDLISIISMERRKVIKMLSEVRDCLGEIDNNKYGDFRKHLEEALEYLGKLEKEV